MRSISIQEFEKDPKACIAEAEAGQRLILLRGGKPVAEIVPASETDSTREAKEQKRLAAVRRLTEIMDKGVDLGGLRITSRDELYERD
jgi:antitoxin (DNA-binding transcriptional repressor) of toxin-antitoxin stability system